MKGDESGGLAVMDCLSTYMCLPQTLNNDALSVVRLGYLEILYGK